VPPAELLLDTQTEQTVPLLTHLRQDRTIHPLRAEHIDVVELCQLLGRERLGRAEHHVPRIVHDHVDATMVGDDPGDRAVDRVLGQHVKLDASQIDSVLLRERRDLGDLRRVAARGFAHRGVDGVAGLGKSLGGQTAEAAGSARDEDDLGHVPFSCA
jgi:hypothetical protein